MWVKGNLHCHTIASDGDTEPSAVCRFYAKHGYHFLSITDHMRRVEPSWVDDAHGLLLIPGEEMQTRGDDAPEAPLHVNGIGVTKRLSSEPAETRAQAIQACIDAILDDGGIAQINHPNWHYAFNHEVISGTRGALLLEIFNGHPAVQNEGDADHISVERMWDHLLSAGRVMYAVAVDDSHHFHEFAPQMANPGRGWVWARVEHLTMDDVLSAIRRGDFYASTGVELKDLQIGLGSIRLSIRKPRGESFVTRFIGNDGDVLEESDSAEPSFQLPANSGYTYLRAKVISPDGKCAWTQPVARPLTSGQS